MFVVGMFYHWGGQEVGGGRGQEGGEERKGRWGQGRGNWKEGRVR